MIVVGRARISTVLGKAKWTEVALTAQAEFVKFLKEKVRVYVSSDEETVILLEGTGRAGGEDALKEAGKAVERTSKKLESVADGLVRGLQLLHMEVNEKDKTLTLVYGWDAATAKAAKAARKGLEDGDDKGGKTDGKPAADKAIEDKKVSSTDAKKFLRKN